MKLLKILANWALWLVIPFALVGLLALLSAGVVSYKGVVSSPVFWAVYFFYFFLSGVFVNDKSTPKFL